MKKNNINIYMVYMYDCIFIGTSVPMLYFIYEYVQKNKDKKILIFESNKDKIGGAWHTISNSYAKNIDSAIHFITIYKDYKEIISKFKKINIYLDRISDDKFICKYENYKIHKKQGILYCKKGWDNLISNLFNILMDYDNIKIIYNFVNDICINYDSAKIILCNGKIFNSKKLFIPAMININYININNKKIFLVNDNLEKNTSIHVLVYINSNHIKYNENFHGVYDGSDFFDRVMFITNNIVNEKVNLIAILRISRNFKKYIKSLNFEIIEKFLKKENLLESFSIIDFTINFYKFYSRYHSYDINSKRINNNVIEMIDSRDFGKLLSYF